MDGGRGIVLQQLLQPGVRTILPQDHIVPILQLVQDVVPAAIPAPGETEAARESLAGLGVTGESLAGPG